MLRAIVEAPVVDGVIDRSGVRAAIRALSGAMSACYARAWGQQPFESEVAVRFVIGDDGRARSAVVSGPQAQRVSSCVSRTVSSARFPAATATDAIVRFSLRLRAR